MKFSNYSLFSTEQNTKGLEYALEHTAKLGFDAVEWIDRADMDNPKIADVKAANTVKKELDGRELSLTCYSLLLNLAAEDYEVQMERAFRNIEYAAILGAPYFHHTVVPHYNYSELAKTSREDMLRLVADRAETVAKRCNEYGIVCLYEPQGIFFNGVKGLSLLLGEMKSRGCKVGICGDTGNSMFVDTPPIEIFKTFIDDIKHVHVKDYAYSDKDLEKSYRTLRGKIIYETALGGGGCSPDACLELVRDYPGNISFEMLDSDEEMRNNIKFVKNILNK